MTRGTGTSWVQATGIALVCALSTAGAVILAGLVLDRERAGGVVIAPSTAPSIVVEVLGAVASPGVVTVPPSARLIDVLAAAGGLSEQADRGGLNLAARVADGERIEVPARVPVSAAGSVPPDTGAISGLIDLNTAGTEQLDTLPNIGPALAARIIEDRERNGPFASVDDLDRVSGISPAMVDEMRPLVTVDD